MGNVRPEPCKEVTRCSDSDTGGARRIALNAEGSIAGASAPPTCCIAAACDFHRLRDALNAACLCDACAAKYQEVTGEPHRQREIAATEARLAEIARVIALLPAAEKELAALRETNTRLNRRAQLAEAGLRERILSPRHGGSFGRALANAGAAMWQRDAEQERLDLDVMSERTRVTTELLRRQDERLAMAFVERDRAQAALRLALPAMGLARGFVHSGWLDDFETLELVAALDVALAAAGAALAETDARQESRRG